MIRNFFRSIFEQDLEEYYKSAIGSLSVAIFLFTFYKLIDYIYSGIAMGFDHAHFGHIVETYPVLQWIFQFFAFLSVGLIYYFVGSVNRAKERFQDREGAIQKVKDLTEELASMDKKIRAEKESYRLIIERQHEMVTKFDPDGTITFANKANYSFYGFQHWQDMLGKNVYEMVKDYCSDLKQRLVEMTPENPRERHTEAMLSNSGKIVYIDWVNCGIFNDQGQVIKYQSVGRDITKIVEAKKKTEISEEKYRLLFTHNIAGYAIHSIVCEGPVVCDYLFIEVNPMFQRMFGFEEEEIIGKTVLEVMPHTEPSLIKRFGMVASTGQADNFHCYFSDIKKWFEVSAFRPQENHFAATFIDITPWRDRTGKKDRLTDN